MTTLTWPGRELPVTDYDVVVCGAGMAGCTAAIRAARDGLKTALIEYFGTPGGIPSTGLLGVISGQRRVNEYVVGGMLLEIEDRVHLLGGVSGDWRNRYDPETLQLVLLRMLKEAGVETLFYTQLIDAVRDRDRVTHAVAAGKAGIEAFAAKLFIDSTGDGDLAARAGCEFAQGRPEDGLTQSATLVFIVGNVDRGRAPDRAGMNRIWKQHQPDLPINHVVMNWLPGSDDCLAVNMVHVLRFDGTDSRELSRARFEGADQAQRFVEVFRELFPGFERCRVVRTGQQIGVRETRRILGDYVLTNEDVLGGRCFTDEIARCGWGVDVHNPDGMHTGIGHHIERAYGIPYGCLLPRGVANLYVVGRPISSEHLANSSSRINATCIATGHAAGAAAKAAIAAGNTRGVDVAALRRQLLDEGAILRVDPTGDGA